MKLDSETSARGSLFVALDGSLSIIRLLNQSIAPLLSALRPRGATRGIGSERPGRSKSGDVL